jgi:1-acyl-sn-glycerol-3-phosphate acyltransferase
MSLLDKLCYDVCRYSCKLAFLTGFSMRSEGGHNVPNTGPALIIANHASYFDPPAVGVCIQRRIHYLARKTLFNNPLFGALIRRLNAVPVDQEGVATEGLKATLRLLKGGEAVLIFPEGERTWTGKMQPLKPGVGLLIRQVDMPVIPVGIAGVFDAFPRSHLLPANWSPLFLPARKKGSFAVSIGRPLDSRKLRQLPREQMLDEMFQSIHAMCERAERLRRKA